MDLAALTYDAAKPLEGASFAIETADGTALQLTLDDVQRLETPRRRRSSTGDADRRVPFSLSFVGPPHPVLPQAIYTLRGDVATFERIFIVPIGRDDGGTDYEAVFT